MVWGYRHGSFRALHLSQSDPGGFCVHCPGSSALSTNMTNTETAYFHLECVASFAGFSYPWRLQRERPIRVGREPIIRGLIHVCDKCLSVMIHVTFIPVLVGTSRQTTAWGTTPPVLLPRSQLPILYATTTHRDRLTSSPLSMSGDTFHGRSDLPVSLFTCPTLP